VAVTITITVTWITCVRIPEAMPWVGLADRQPDTRCVTAALQDVGAGSAQRERGLAEMDFEIAKRVRVAVGHVGAWRVDVTGDAEAVAALKARLARSERRTRLADLELGLAAAQATGVGACRLADRIR
jgi:hypothetical protein